MVLGEAKLDELTAVDEERDTSSLLQAMRIACRGAIDKEGKGEPILRW